MLMTALISLPFLFLPWIPGLRDIPKLTRICRIMWGDYYRLVARRRAVGSAAGTGSGIRPAGTGQQLTPSGRPDPARSCQRPAAEPDGR